MTIDRKKFMKMRAEQRAAIKRGQALARNPTVVPIKIDKMPEFPSARRLTASRDIIFSYMIPAR